MQFSFVLIFWASIDLVRSKECTKPENLNCPKWKKDGDCSKVLDQCPLACGVCTLSIKPSDGNWSKWSSWTKCSQTCGGGVQKSFRHCNDPTPYHDGLACEAKDGTRQYREELTRTCNPQICNDPCIDKEPKKTCEHWRDLKLCDSSNKFHDKMIQFCKETCGFCGTWEQWTSYTKCSVTCGGKGERVRERVCNNTESSPRTKYCLSKDQKMEILEKEGVECNSDVICPVDGNWGVWGSWSGNCCSDRSGTATRSRRCDSPAPQGAGSKCMALSGTEGKLYEKETRSCADIVCPIHGNWGDWGVWSECSCDDDTENRRRNRNCDDPLPKDGGLECLMTGTTNSYGMFEEELNSCKNETCVTTNSSRKAATGTASLAYIIGAIVAGCLVFLLLLIVLIIYCRKRKSKALDKEELPWAADEAQDHNTDPSIGLINTKKEEAFPLPPPPPEEELYAYTTEPSEALLSNTAETENGLLYSDVGEGGGRIGYRLKTDEPTNYAEVKTEGTYYPPLNSSEDSPVYTTPSQDSFEKQTDSEEYDSIHYDAPEKV